MEKAKLGYKTFSQNYLVTFPGRSWNIFGYLLFRDNYSGNKDLSMFGITANAFL
jgi:hypothetical protein